MKLYYKAGACALFPHIILCETSLTFSIESVDLSSKITESGEDFFKINPKGQVPTLLLEDGSIITEGVVIAQYIAEQAKDSKLLPEVGFLERYKVLEWLNFIAMDLHKSFGPLYLPTSSLDAKEAARCSLKDKFKQINNLLYKQHYLAGNDFTLADAYLYVILSWAYQYQLLSEYPALTTYFNRLAQRPSIKLAREMEGLPEQLHL